MLYKKAIIGIILFYGLGITSIKAQETVSSAGGTISGNGGNASYTIGQIAYTTNLSTTGSVAEGVQQPFEISTLTELETINDSDFDCLAFPNPTTNSITLLIKENTSGYFSCQLFNIKGILLETINNIEHKNDISLSKFEDSVFILKVIINGEVVKTFKIIKKS